MTAFEVILWYIRGRKFFMEGNFNLRQCLCPEEQIDRRRSKKKKERDKGGRNTHTHTHTRTRTHTHTHTHTHTPGREVRQTDRQSQEVTQKQIFHPTDSNDCDSRKV